MITYLLTGGTGTFGNAMVEKLQKVCPDDKIIVFSRDEYKQLKMSARFPEGKLMRYFVGDVRDEERLLKALQNVDIVIHAAALKQVPSCEYNPDEAVKTNIYGATNIINACLRTSTVRKVLALSSDKACLDYHSRIELEDGSSRSIRDIVVNKESHFVRTFDGEKFIISKIVGWYKNPKLNRELIKVSYKNASYSSRKTRKGVLVTEDHLILTPNGWIVANKLKNGDLIVTSEPAPNEKQLSFLIGCLIGDSCIVVPNKKDSKRNNSKPFIKFGHSEDQLEWLKIKYKIFKELGLNSIKKYESNGKQNFYSFSIGAKSFIVSLYPNFYKNNKRIMPRQLIETYFSPELMVSWYLDDGTLSRKNARIGTQSYCKNDVEWISNFLTTKGLDSYCYKHIVDNKIYYELRFTIKGTEKLFDFIAGLIPESMKYKIYKYKRSNSSIWDFGSVIPFCDEVVIEKGKQFNRDVYCIDIENTHNFSSNNIIVHNCAPINLYGATKLVAEKLFISANAFSQRKTFFSVVRYGNVLASRGSVVEVFKRQIENNEPITVTAENMTRFWWTIGQAADFVLQAINCMYGGEVFVPKLKSSNVAQLLKALGGNFKNIKLTGIRPGEKMHEVLIARDEMANTYDLEWCYVVYPLLAYFNVVKQGNLVYNLDGYTSYDVSFEIDELKELINTTKE